MQLSYAKLHTFQQCPLRYRFTYLDRLPRRPRRLFRTAKRVHHALMAWLTYARSGQPSLAEALRTYERGWGVEEQPEVRETREFVEGVELLHAFHELNVGVPSVPAFLEHRFDVDVGPHRLTGQIDRVDLTESGYEVIDYKLNRELKTQREVDHDLQLGIYAFAVRETWGVLPDALSLYFVRHNLKLTTLRTRDQIEELGDWMLRSAATISTTRHFEPTPGDWCGGCDFRSVCPAVTGRPMPLELAADEQMKLPLPDEEAEESQLSLNLSP
jgi:putative RecB family exonuclease